MKHDNSSTAAATYAAAVVLNGAIFAKAMGASWLLQAALRSRRVITQATGILLSRHSGSPEDAFAWLRQAAERSDVTVLQAAAVVDADASPS